HRDAAAVADRRLVDPAHVEDRLARASEGRGADAGPLTAEDVAAQRFALARLQRQPDGAVVPVGSDAPERRVGRDSGRPYGGVAAGQPESRERLALGVE